MASTVYETEICSGSSEESDQTDQRERYYFRTLMAKGLLLLNNTYLCLISLSYN